MSSQPASKTDVAALLTAQTREIIGHFNQSQGLQNERLDKVDAKIDAIMEMLATRRELQNLVNELQAKGMALDLSRIFVAHA